MSEKITVLIPCKDERLNIGACIDSVRGLADEILIADSLSSDETLEIVRNMCGCRIIEREFIDYANFKNWAIPQATHPWVLIVDADERLTPELIAEIKTTLREAPDDVDGYFVPRQWHFLGHPIHYSGWQTDKLLRLIRRDRCRYGACRVHEEIEYDKRRVRSLTNKLLHYSYWTYDEFFAKHLRYTKWGAQDQWDRGKRASAWSLLVRPMLRFLQLYILRRGFLDGLPGLQMCLMTAFFNTFVKQARLWEMEKAIPQPEPAHAANTKLKQSA